MTNDQQQVEAWREQFEDWAKSNGHNTTLKHQGHYLNFSTFKAWDVWLAAKRNQPVIELPDPDHYYMDDDVYDADEVHAAITAAGYSYKVKE